MLDSFEILTTSGVVLWSKSYVPVSSNVINALINDIFIEERVPSGTKSSDDNRASRNPPYKKERYTLKWTTAKDLGLMFVAVYQSLLHLSWVDNLLDVVRSLFVKQYGKQLKASKQSNLDCSNFGPTFDALVTKLSGETVPRSAETDSPSTTSELTPPSSSPGTEDGHEEPAPPPPIPGLRKAAAPKTAFEDNISTDATPIPTPDTSRPSSPAVNHLLTGKGGPAGRGSRRSRKALTSTSAPVSSGDESPAQRPASSRKASAKQKRRWDADGFAVEGDDDGVLDYSVQDVQADGEDMSAIQDVSADQMGSRTAKGVFELKDLDDEVDAILAESKAKDTTSEASSGLVGSSLGAISGYFRNVVGGKQLTKEDLAKPLKNLEDHLLQKNVAREAAVRLCNSVEQDMIGLKTANFTSIDTTIRASMSKALTRMLTPTTSLDLLRAITSTTTSATTPRPYVISIVGVNGVGKSTNLSKIAYFLLQNNFRVLICAADTFRSGAVEQLRVHVRNLSELSKREQVGQVELFEKGYGKDAAAVARDAIVYATGAQGLSGRNENMLFDVVLIDTAGRRHNDTRLMSSLTKFGQLANPDKIFMVGEALVGTDSVAQARNFSAQFVDTKGKGRGLDGFIISKCDTVNDSIGTMVSMVHATGIPVVFVGIGQHYNDLRQLNVDWAVSKLMK